MDFFKRTKRDWVEDFSHENGNYQNKCVFCDELFFGHKRRVVCDELFFGHKRRVVCKVCDQEDENITEPPDLDFSLRDRTTDYEGQDPEYREE